MANKFNLRGLEQKARASFEASLILIGNEARNHFKQSFINQGFEDKSVEKWQPRKVEDKSKKGNRAILVKSGHLRNSIRLETINKANLSVRIATRLPYAQIHNSGGVINKGVRTGQIYFRIKKDGTSRFAKKRNSNFQQKAVFDSHTINMPKRQYIGNSFVLNQKIKRILYNQMSKIFK